MTPAEMRRALAEDGGFLLGGAVDEALCRAVLSAARALFALPAAEKEALRIERSAHYRGWSQMHNERDYREQIHFGRELPAAGDDPPYLRLVGPNLWPPDPAFRAAVLAYMDAVARVGEGILKAFTEGAGGVAEEGYLLLKMIGYHPQPAAAPRSGVAAHVDFSWLTLTLQDSAGLAIRRPDGVWVEVACVEGALWVHPGEILELATGGRYRATPHRVLNRSTERTRVSMPLFLNPPLTATVRALAPAAERAPEDEGHVHRVLGASREGGLHFGEAEWRRKGLEGWCAECSPGRL